MVNGPLTRAEISCGPGMPRVITAKAAMEYLKSFPALEGLVDLANRDDIDINPTLLRVLTDLYVTKPTHSSEEERQYTELALRLLDTVDVSARHDLARRLASYAQAPLPVVRRLVRDVIAVAEPILRHSQALSSSELFALAQEAGPGHVAAVAAREDLGSHSTHGNIVSRSEPFAGSSAAASELSELFFSANTTERRLILLNLDYAPLPAANPVNAQLASEAVPRIEAAALSHKIETLAHELARALAISHRQARQLTDDPTGEPIVVAAKALGMPADVLQRILLCLNPAISQSVQRVYDLSDLYEELKPDSALRLVAIWQSGYKPQQPAHQPQLSIDETRPRPDAATAQRCFPTTRAPDQRASTKRS